MEYQYKNSANLRATLLLQPIVFCIVDEVVYPVPNQLFFSASGICLILYLYGLLTAATANDRLRSCGRKWECLYTLASFLPSAIVLIALLRVCSRPISLRPALLFAGKRNLDAKSANLLLRMAILSGGNADGKPGQPENCTRRRQRFKMMTAYL